MDKANVAIIIVTPETGELLDRCLKSLARQTTMPDELFVVLNGCGGADELSAKWRDTLPIRIISLDRNAGFAKAVIQAMPHITSKWVGVINADAFAESDWLEEMLKAGETSHDVAAVASAVLMADDPTLMESLGIEVGASGTAYLSKLGSPYREGPVQDVFGASGAAAIYRREAITQVGFFDPRFFVYYEDVDLAWRLRWAGWRAVAAPRARVHHKGSAFAKHAPKTYHLHKNKLAVMVLNWPISVILDNLAYILAMEISSIFFSVFKERSMDSIKARCSFILELPGFILERRKRLKKRIPGAEKWIFDDREKALKRLKWKLQ